MDEKLLGKCGFYCGGTRDCVKEEKRNWKGVCMDFEQLAKIENESVNRSYDIFNEDGLTVESLHRKTEIYI